MKILLFPNGPDGWQTGIEDGFNHLVASGLAVSVEFYYLEDLCRKIGAKEALAGAAKLASEIQPDFIGFFHVGNLPLPQSFIDEMKALPSSPIIAYDEGDMYGSWSKPITPTMKTVIRAADVVSLRGLGRIRRDVAKLNPTIIYTPHHADIARFDRKPHVLEKREISTLLIGNRIKTGRGGRMPGAAGRERFVRFMGKEFPGRFTLHGNGWNGFLSDCGPVAFQEQMEYYRRSRVTMAYEHYPEIPYYFSNRLPIALMAGALYVCHRHGGYDELFKGLDFIFPFDTHAEAADLVHWILAMPDHEVFERGVRAREFALCRYTPQVVWSNFFKQVLHHSNRHAP